MSQEKNISTISIQGICVLSQAYDSATVELPFTQEQHHWMLNKTKQYKTVSLQYHYPLPVILASQGYQILLTS